MAALPTDIEEAAQNILGAAYEENRLVDDLTGYIVVRGRQLGYMPEIMADRIPV